MFLLTTFNKPMWVFSTQITNFVWYPGGVQKTPDGSKVGILTKPLFCIPSLKLAFSHLKMAGKGRRWSFPFGIRHLFRCFSCSFSESVLSFVAKKTTCENSRPWGRWGWKFGIGLALCLGGADDIPFLCGIWTLNHDRFEEKSQASSFFGGGGWVGKSILSGTPKGSSEVKRISLLITWNGRATRQFDFTIASRMPRLRIRVNGQQREITAPLALHARIRAAWKRASGKS